MVADKTRLTLRDLYIALVGVSTVYWILAEVVPSELLNDVLDGGLIALCIMVTVLYIKWSFTHVTAIADGSVAIRVGIVLSWFGTGIWRLERMFLQLHVFGYRGPIGLHDPLRGYMICVLMIAAFYHIVAFEMLEPGIPNTWALRWSGGVAGLGMGIMLLIKLFGL